MVAGVENAVILTDQLVPGILTDGAELVVHIGNCALDVSHRYDRVLIQSELLIGQFLQLTAAGSESFLYGFFDTLPLRDFADGCGDDDSFCTFHWDQHEFSPKPVSILSPTLNI